jgi:hypothetical protein
MGHFAGLRNLGLATLDLRGRFLNQSYFLPAERLSRIQWVNELANTALEPLLAKRDTALAVMFVTVTQVGCGRRH